MFLSVVIPTIGREKLARAVESVLRQDVPAPFEVLVVNDSGRPLSPAPWQHDPRVRVLHTPQVERSAARNAGARDALGDYLLFLDDDDYMLPGAFAAFHRAAASGAGFIFGRSRLVDRDGVLLVELQYDRTELVTPQFGPLLTFEGAMQGNCFTQIMAGEFIPIMASIYKKTIFQQTGGFFEPISCAEDVDMTRHIALYADALPIPETVVCAELGSAGSTTDKSTGSEQSHFARERILDKPEAYPRLLNSARKGSYWYGRILRTYASSFLWNLRRRGWRRLPHRAALAAACLFHAGPAVLDRAFWQGVRIHYLNGPYIRGFLRAGWE